MSPTLEQRSKVKEKPKDLVILEQTWEDLLFLHWECDPKLLTDKLPNGLNLDTFKGKAYVGVIPFNLKEIKPAFFGPFPGLSFYELNVRTYVYDKNGQPGVWFFSLDADSYLAVEFTKNFLWLPYVYSSFNVKKDSGFIHYKMKRKDKEEWSQFSYKPEGEGFMAQPNSLEDFLVERYLLFTQNPNGTLYSARVSHKPYLLSKAALPLAEANILDWNGIQVTEKAPASVLYSPFVELSTYNFKRIL